MIFENGLSVLLVPHKNGKVLEVKISNRILVLLLAGLFLLLSSSLFLLLNASERAYDKLRLSRLKKENNRHLRPDSSCPALAPIISTAASRGLASS